MEQKEVEGFEVPIRRALTERMFWGGVPRELFLINLLSSAFIVLILRFKYYLGVAILAHFIFKYLAKNDPFVFDIFTRYRRTEKYYWS